ncbi:MAG: hypothetical protein IKA57_06675 [Clostridia bacterium]|nr:hypothetical protein [Clostridia bacterium]
MKIFNKKNFKRTLLSFTLGAASVACGIAGIALNKSVDASAATLSATQYQTDGASIRVFKKAASGDLVETDKSGIRFHVEMGKGYAYEGTTLVTEEKSEKNGSFKLAEGYKTYTLIIPSRLLGANDLTVDTPTVKMLDTTEYWYADKDGNLESVAYIYNIPDTKYTDTFAFRGIICKVNEDGTETKIAETDIADRQLSYVAKRAYNDTMDPSYLYWAKDEDFEANAAEKIKEFIPTYTLVYNVNGTEKSEEVLWGDTPKAIPSFDVANDPHLEYAATWFDAESNKEFDVTSALSYDTSRTINLTHASTMDFKLTGVADYNNFTVNGTNYSGIKVYATLPVGDFYTADEIANGTDKMVEIAKGAVKVDYEGSGSFSGLQGVWALLEGKGSGAQMRLIFAFDSSTMRNGDKLILRDDSVFYAKNIMYALTEEYTIDYQCDSAGNEDYGVFLGYLHNSDVEIMENWDEFKDGTRLRIRVTFKNDLLINSDFEFKFDGALPEGYEYAVYTQCNDTGVKTPITQGYYYWNEGEHTILELDGYAYHNNDELYGAPGTKIVQNGGYYIFEDAMYAYYNGSAWVNGSPKGSFGANAFEWRGWDATDTTEIRFTTNSNTALIEGGATNRWFDKVVPMKSENMSDTEPYAVYFTDVDGRKTEITDFMYHGQAAGSGYNHIFAFKNFKGTKPGQMVTVIGGTRFWAGAEYFTATETMSFYFNGRDWIANHAKAADETIAFAEYIDHGYNYFEVGLNKLRLHFANEKFNGAGAGLYLESGSVKVNNTAYTNLHYHGSGNKIFEIIGDANNAIGKNAFADVFTIEKGTRVWMNGHCLEFTDEWSLTYIGEALRDSSGNKYKYEWVRNSQNIEVNKNNIVRLYNVDDAAGGEVRLELTAGILTNSYYGFAAVDPAKGLPVVNGKTFSDTAFSYANSNNLIAVRGGEFGRHDGDYIKIPKGSVWWTTQGSITFTEEIFYTYENGAWVTGDRRATADVTVENATVTGLDHLVVGKVYPFTVTPADGYTVASVTINGVDTPITANNVYNLVAQTTNEIVIATLEGYNVTFNIEDGATVTANGSAITDGMIKAVASGETLTFSVAVDGCRLDAVSGATDNGNGTYTVSAEGTVTITTVKQWTVNYNIPENVTAILNGAIPVSGEGSITVDEGTYSATISANAGYILKSVKANGAELTATGNTYTINLNSDITLTAEVIDPINVSNSMVSRKVYYLEDVKNDAGEVTQTFRGIRIYFDPEKDAELAAVTGGNYGITMTGNVSLTMNGAPATPEYYSYFGLIDGTQHQALEVRFDLREWKNGDKLVIEQGTYFSFNGTYIYFDEDVSAENYTVTWNTPANANVIVRANAEYLQDGEKMGGDVSLKTNAMVLKGTTLTITVEPETNYEVKDITVNGTSIGVPSGTYQVSGETTISATTAKLSYAVTWTDPANATISVTANGAAISNGAMVEAGTTLTVTVEPTAIKYAVSSVKINGEDKGTSGVYSYSVTSAVTIEAEVAEKSDDAKKAEIFETIKGDIAKYTGSTLTVDENGNLVSNGSRTSIQFTNDFFTLLNEYGYESIEFDMSKTSGQTSNNYYYQTSAGNTAFISAARGAKTQTKSNVSISSAVTYKAQYKTRSNGTLRDDSSTWTLSGISFS